MKMKSSQSTSETFSLAKKPPDGHFPKNGKRIRKEQSKIFAQRMSHTRRVKAGEEEEATDADSEEHKNEVV